MLDSQISEEAFSVMPEWGMAYVMAECNRFDQVFIEAQETSNSSGYTGHKLYMENPVGYVIIINKIEHLGLVNIADIGPGVEDAIGVQCKLLAITFLYFGISSDPKNTAGSIW